MAKDPLRRQQPPKTCPRPQTSDIQVQDRDFQVENQPSRWRLNKRTSYLFIYNEYWRLYPNSLISIQILFVYNFVITHYLLKMM